MLLSWLLNQILVLLDMQTHSILRYALLNIGIGSWTQSVAIAVREPFALLLVEASFFR